MNNISQIADTVIMVRPDHFGFNSETAATNHFQKNEFSDPVEVRNNAMKEFAGMVRVLKTHGISVLDIPSRLNTFTPDAVFPNNWFSHHHDGTLIIYPMLSKNRRMERQTDTLKTALNKANINHLKVFDISYLELNNQFLEGTGSLVLDRVNKTAFAVYSPRTTYAAVELWCKRMGYRYITFRAYDDENLPIYHTNVMMSIGNEFAVLAADAIADKKERQDVLIRLKKINKEIITISKKQVNDFCANILQLKNAAGERKIILSQTAFEAFSLLQKKMLGKFGELVPVKIPTIETVGGGSARCMLAEVFR